MEKSMERLRQGDIDALDEIYALTSRGVYLLAFSILKSGEKAQDIMQETFLRVAANIDKYRAGTNPKAWIFRIARNLSFREYNAGKRTEALEEQEIADHKEGEQFWTQNIDLNNALSKLSAEEREIVTLYSLAGYKHREIAAIVDKPLGTVLWIYHKAIKRLKKLLK